MSVEVGEGQVLGGRYRLLRLLRTAAWGALYEAERVRGGGRRLAIQVIDPSLTPDESTAERVLAELEAISHLTAPGVIVIRDIEHAPEGLCYYTYDLPGGASLAAILTGAGGRLAPHRATSLVIQVLDALAFAHARGIVHGGLETDSVLVEPEEAGGREQIRVRDFGLRPLAERSSPGVLDDLRACAELLCRLVGGPRSGSSRAPTDGLPLSLQTPTRRALGGGERGAPYGSAAEFRAALAAVLATVGDPTHSSGASPATPSSPGPPPTPSHVPVSTPSKPGSIGSLPGKQDSTRSRPGAAAPVDEVHPPTPHGGTLQIGKVIGRYRIEGILGEGGMGTVYRARHMHMHRPAALKVLHPARATDPVLRERFMREARIASRLRHPNVVEVYDLDMADGVLHIAMELVEGDPLWSLLRRGPLGPERLARVFDQILDALAAAHVAGVVHRDLKPSNIMIGDKDFVKVLDFGIARLLEYSGPPGSPPIDGISEIGEFIGTPAYASPEQVRGLSVDGRADIYQLGIMLFECLSGRRPFRGETTMEVLNQHVSMPPPLLRAFRPDLAGVEALERVVGKALAKDRDERFQTAAEMRAAIHEAIDVAAPQALRTPLPFKPVPPPPPPSPGRAPVISASPPPSPVPHHVEVTPTDVQKGLPRAMLRVDGVAGVRKVFLFDGNRLLLGRTREDARRSVRNDVVLRALPCRDSRLDPENWKASARISQAHFEVVIDAASAWLVDRSSRGTVVNGTAAQRDWPFPLPESFDLDIAHHAVTLRGSLLRRGVTRALVDGSTDLNDPASLERIDAVVLRRTSSAQDHVYALVAGMLPLDRVVPTSLPLARRVRFLAAGELLAIEVTGDASGVKIDGAKVESAGMATFLRPGMQVQVGNIKIAVDRARAQEFLAV